MSPEIRELAASINGEVVGMLRFGAELGLKESVAGRLMDELLSRLQRSLPDIASGLAARATPGQQRLINAILAMPIREMGARLARP